MKKQWSYWQATTDPGVNIIGRLISPDFYEVNMARISKAKKLEILDILGDYYKDTKTALEYKTPFQLLVSTALAAQTTDIQVNKCTKDLYEKYPDAKAMSTLTVEELEPYIKSIGLYHNKAKNVIALSKKLVEDFNGEVPADRDLLTTLPGIGRKTANVVLSIAFNIPAFAVDTHVFRVTNRLGLANADNVLDTENQVCELIPKDKWNSAHHWLIWHGRRICKAQNPLCDECPVKDLCANRNHPEKIKKAK